MQFILKMILNTVFRKFERRKIIIFLPKGAYNVISTHFLNEWIFCRQPYIGVQVQNKVCREQFSESVIERGRGIGYGQYAAEDRKSVV